MRFGDEAIRPKPHPVTYSLVKALEERPLDVKKAFQDYTAPAEGLQGGFFSPPEPYQVFNDTIGRLGGTEVHPADWATVTPATEEQKAAVDEILEPKPKPTREEQKEARVMTDPPNVDIARNNIANSVLSKTVTPETVRNLLESDPVTAPHADWTMEVMGTHHSKRECNVSRRFSGHQVCSSGVDRPTGRHWSDCERCCCPWSNPVSG